MFLICSPKYSYPAISATTCTSQGTKVREEMSEGYLQTDLLTIKKLDCDKLLGNKVQRSNES